MKKTEKVEEKKQDKKKLVIAITALAVVAIGIIIVFSMKNSNSLLKEVPELKTVEFNIKVTGLVNKTIDESILDEIDLTEGTMQMETTAKTIREYNYKGLKLDEIINYLNANDYNEITFVANDGYKATIKKSDLEGAVLMLTNDDEVIEREDSYFKLGVPKLDSKKWVNAVVEMEIK